MSKKKFNIKEKEENPVENTVKSEQSAPVNLLDIEEYLQMAKTPPYFLQSRMKHGMLNNHSMRNAKLEVWNKIFNKEVS